MEKQPQVRIRDNGVRGVSSEEGPGGDRAIS